MKKSYLYTIAFTIILGSNIFSQSLFLTTSGLYSNSVHSSFPKTNSSGYGGHFRVDFIPRTSRLGLFTMYGIRSYHFTTQSEGTTVNEQKNHLVLVSLSQAFNRGGFTITSDFGFGAAFTEKIASSVSEKKTDLAINLGFTGIAQLSNSMGLHTSVAYLRYFDNKLNSGYVLGSVGLFIKIF